MANQDKLDTTDIKMLKILQQNSRLTVKELAAKVNYREQLECLYDRRRKAGAADSAVMSYTEPVHMDGRRVDSATLEQLIEVMERAGFSSDPITEEEFRLSMERIRELFHKAGKG